MDKKISAINEILMAMLGNGDLVARWWDSPNKNWEGRTPKSIYLVDPDEVINYILKHCQS